jgi:hypothetical protein
MINEKGALCTRNNMQETFEYADAISEAHSYGKLPEKERRPAAVPRRMRENW